MTIHGKVTYMYLIHTEKYVFLFLVNIEWRAFIKTQCFYCYNVLIFLLFYCLGTLFEGIPNTEMSLNINNIKIF